VPAKRKRNGPGLALAFLPPVPGVGQHASDSLGDAPSSPTL
jgi:hypothetical protein